MSAYRNRILQTQSDHLIGYWTLGETLGTTAKDLSGHDHDGTANGVQWGEDGIGDGNRAAQFDGVNDYINLYSTGLSQAFNDAAGTILVWAKLDTAAWTTQQAFYSLIFWADSSNFVSIYKQASAGQNNRITFHYVAGGVSKGATPLVVDTDGWVCFALTWDKAADVAQGYQNGVASGAAMTGLGTWAGPAVNAVIGAQNTSPSGVWQGSIAHVVLWDVALSAAEIGVLAMQSSAPTVWAVDVDWERDGSFVHELDNITDWVMSAQWFLGEKKTYQDTADDSTLTLTLRNVDKRFSPENSSGPLAGKLGPFKPIRIQSNDGLDNRTHWVGWIERIQPKVNINGERTAEITAAGPMQFLKAAETHLALQENQRTDEIVDKLLQEVVIPPTLDKVWILGRVGNSELGRATYLAITAAYSVLDEGATTLALAGDNWVNQGGANDQKKNTFDVYQAIKDVVAAERGRFLFARDGKALFWNRHHLLQGESAEAVFDNAMSDMEYQYAGVDQFKNEIVVICHPRALSETDNEVLWKLDEPTEIPGGKDYSFTVKYQDDAGNRIGGKDVRVENAQFWKPGAIRVVADNMVRLDAGANSATLLVLHRAHRPIGLMHCELRGWKITDLGQLEAAQSDPVSISDYGRRSLRLNLPSVDNLVDADLIAQFELHRRSQPDGMISSMTLKSHGIQAGGHHTQQLARTLGDKVSISEDQTAHEGDYHIIGEQHRLSDGATLLETTWYLEPAAEVYPWKLGVEGRSELGQTTVVVY